MNNVEIYLLDKQATLPTRNHKDDAGLDIYALEDTFIPISQTVLVKTGIAINVPKGYVGLLKERSSIGKKGLKVAGGVIDTGYSGDVSVLLMNVSNKEVNNGYMVKKGERIAQLILSTIITPNPILVDKLWDSNRGSKGFGSSGA